MYIKVTLKIINNLHFFFQDVTEPATEHYAAYPVIEARLPHDFFYPFVTSSSNRTVLKENCQILASIFTVIWMFAEK